LGFVARTRRPRATPTRARARERVVIRIIHPAHRTRAADVAARARVATNPSSRVANPRDVDTSPAHPSTTARRRARRHHPHHRLARARTTFHAFAHARTHVPRVARSRARRRMDASTDGWMDARARVPLVARARDSRAIRARRRTSPRPRARENCVKTR